MFIGAILVAPLILSFWITKKKLLVGLIFYYDDHVLYPTSGLILSDLVLVISCLKYNQKFLIEYRILFLWLSRRIGGLKD